MITTATAVLGLTGTLAGGIVWIITATSKVTSHLGQINYQLQTLNHHVTELKQVDTKLLEQIDKNEKRIDNLEASMHRKGCIRRLL